MPQRDVAAKRYAQAVASMAADAGAWDAWLDNLAALRVVLTEPSAAAFFLSSKVALEAKYRALDEALAAQLAEARSLAKLLVADPTPRRRCRRVEAQRHRRPLPPALRPASEPRPGAGRVGRTAGRGHRAELPGEGSMVGPPGLEPGTCRL